MRTGLLFFACLLLPACAWAQIQNGVTLVTGPNTGTYYVFGKDMAGLASKNFPITVKESEGSVDNIKRVGTADNVTLGIVQSDVLGFLTRSQSTQSKQMISHLRVVFPFYQEEVHVLARDDIKDFRDLQGKRVAVGEEGSGNMLTAVNLFAIQQIVPSSVKKIPPEEAVVAVLKGDLDAVVIVGGAPMRIFKNMEDLTRPENQKFALLLQKVHFLALNDIKFYQEYEPAEISPQDYSFVKSTIPTIAVQAVLVSYEKPIAKGRSKKSAASTERCAVLKKFAALVKSGLPALKQTGHPKWQEVHLSGEVLGWRKDACLAAK